MSTPTDPYSSNPRRPFEDDEILAPLPATSPSSASTPSSGAQVNPPAFVDDSWTDTEIFAHTQGMDPAFDQQEREPEPLDPEPSSPDEAPTALINDDGEAAPVRTSRDDAITDYSTIDYSFGADDDLAEDTGATASYPVASPPQPMTTSVLPTSESHQCVHGGSSAVRRPGSLGNACPCQCVGCTGNSLPGHGRASCDACLDPRSSTRARMDPYLGSSRYAAPRTHRLLSAV